MPEASITQALLLGDLAKLDLAGGPLFATWFVFNFFVAVSVATKLETEPIACLWLSVLSGAGLAIIVVESFDAIFLLRILWFFAAGLVTLFLSFAFRDPHWRKTAEWEKLVIPLLFLALFYARSIYGNISASWGGGKPTPAVFYYVGKPLPLNTDGAEVWVVDEADSGYYFLKSEQDVGVFFVPRDEVAEIRYKKGNP